MSLRQVLRTLLRRTGLVTCAASTLFMDHSNDKKPGVDDKLKFDPPDIKKLTDEYMIQQSTIDAVNSATQSLTITYMAIVKTSNEYKVLLSKLISLSKETVQFQVSDTHWDMILELRSQVQRKKEMLDKLTGYVEYVHKLAVAAAEISYLTGMDSLSLSLSQRIDDALKIIKEEVHYVTALEQEYCHVQEQCIRNTNTSESDESSK